jgi:hypothetical protein
MIREGESIVSGTGSDGVKARVVVGGLCGKFRVLVQEDKRSDPRWDDCRAQVFLTEGQAHDLYVLLGRYLTEHP